MECSCCNSRGYGFNKSHTFLLILIASRNEFLALYPLSFWNCACLISDSGGADGRNEGDSEDDEVILKWKIWRYIEEDEDEDEEKKSRRKRKRKSKKKTTNYGKIATAIGKMRMAGVEVAARY